MVLTDRIMAGVYPNFFSAVLTVAKNEGTEKQFIIIIVIMLLLFMELINSQFNLYLHNLILQQYCYTFVLL